MSENLTPMMKQYMDVKNSVDDALVFYRLGDFYELFFEDAKIASKELDLVLTGRSAGNNQKAPMCGVPYHAAQNYIQKLIAKGYKVAIAEQLEDPKTTKGIVKRDVVQIITPGTTLTNDENQTTVIASLGEDLIYYSLVLCDITTGEIQGVRIANVASELLQALMQYNVRELLVTSSTDAKLIQDIKDKTLAVVTCYEAQQIEPSGQALLKNAATNAMEEAGKSLISYLSMTQKRSLNHLKPLEILVDQAYLQMDYSTLVNLELIQSQRSPTKKATLYSFLDRTSTTMGSRLIKTWVIHPLVDKGSIIKRQNQIAVLDRNYLELMDIRTKLDRCFDIEKILAKIAFGSVNPQDVLRLISTLQIFQSLKEQMTFEHFEFFTDVDDCSSLYTILNNAFNEQAPINLKDGGIFNDGVSEMLDELRSIQRDGKSWLLAYEQAQRDKTGIKNLKVGYTRAFGYYIEVSKGAAHQVKEEYGYIRKQTLTNGERYISEELQSWETKLNQAGEDVLAIEEALFKQYLDIINGYHHQLVACAAAIASLDALGALTVVSHQHGYHRPAFNEQRELKIIGGRHPILENTALSSQYIANSIDMNNEDLVYVLTGPNMGGKSTYMRMIALICIMAQMGCYVPCEEASLPVLDQIFTRMGASDDILMGQSTFMVEMNEAQVALNRATKDSLILFDEIGRGTSTYDGMALAKAIIEYVASVIQAKTIFSTHYHELTSLEQENQQIKNIHVEVHEEDNRVTFLYKVLPGKADKSYGINVARLAHLPQSVLERAADLLVMFEESKHQINMNQTIIKMKVEPEGYIKAREILKHVDVNQMTPLQAMSLLDQIKQILEEK